MYTYAEIVILSNMQSAVINAKLLELLRYQDVDRRPLCEKLFTGTLKLVLFFAFQILVLS